MFTNRITCGHAVPSIRFGALSALIQCASCCIRAEQVPEARGQWPVLASVWAAQAVPLEGKVGRPRAMVPSATARPHIAARRNTVDRCTVCRASDGQNQGMTCCSQQVSLRPASSTDEKYELFRRYQAAVHGESPSEISDRSGWESFLIDAPFPVCVDD